MRKLFGTDGERLFKRVVVRVFSFDNKKHATYTYRAEAKRGFSEKSVQDILERTGSKLEASFPQHDYRLVELGPSEFNFVCKGRRIPNLPVEEQVSA